MKRLAAALAVLLLSPAFLAAITELNCNSICAGAFCQISGSPLPRTGETAVKYSTESSVLLNRFGNGVFCGAFTLSDCIVPNACLQSGGGGGSGNPPETCASYSLYLPPTFSANTQQPGLVSDFWGYNHTPEWLAQCDPQAPPGQRCGMVPSLLVSVRCFDSQKREMQCPAAPVFSANVGNLEPDPVSNLPIYRIWRSVNYATPVTISASMAGCGASPQSASFNLHIFNACSLSPQSAALDLGKNQTFSGTCYDETSQPRPCYYPLIMHPIPDAIGDVKQNTEPTGVPPDNNPPVGTRDARIWMDSTVNFTAGYAEGTGQLSAAGPTFVCASPITVGNPPTACTLSLSSSTVNVGRTLQATPSCTGPGGPTPCPDFQFQAAPAAIVSWSNQSHANVTGVFPGPAAVTARAVARPACALDWTGTLIDLVTPINPQCTFVPRQGTQLLELPSDATNIKAFIVGGGTDDGCTKLNINGQLVLDEGCDAAYCDDSCGGPKIRAHDLNLAQPLAISLAAGSNTISGANLDTCGQFSTLRVHIRGSYQTNQCPTPALMPQPFVCTADLDVQPGPCTFLPNAQTFSGATTNFELIRSTSGNLEAIPGLVLERPDVRLSYSSSAYACGQDFDNGIRSAPGFLAIDKNRFHPTLWQPSAPVTVAMKNLPYDEPPILYVFDGFAPDAYTTIALGTDCVAANRCNDVQYNPETHVLSFQTTGFSSYATASASDELIRAEPLPPSVRFTLDCPLPQIGQNKTRASAFLYVNGTPYANSTMALQFELNQTYAFQTEPASANPATGRHDFVIDTRYGGTYLLRANSGNWTSNSCSLDVFEEETTPIPELNEWLILAVFLAAGLAATRRKE